MQLSYGAVGGANALEDLLKDEFLKQIQRKQLEQQASRDANAADIGMRNAETAAGNLDMRRRDFDASQQSAAAEQAAAGHQNRLRAVIQGSQNLAGTEDPMGALATRNALRVALTSGGAKANEIPQEPVAEKTPAPRPIVSINPRTRKSEVIGEAPAGAHFVQEPAPAQAPAAKDTSALAMRLADDYTRDSKDFTTMNQAMRRVVASAQNPSAAGDMALLYSYMKILDPGSVVRETEFATAAQSGSLPQQIQGAASKVLSGQRLTPEQRADFVNRARALYTEAETGNKAVRESYTQRSKKFGVDPSLVFTDIGSPEPAAPARDGGGGKSVSLSQLQAIAKKRGTSVEQEKQRAAAEGFVVR